MQCSACDRSHSNDRVGRQALQTSLNTGSRVMTSGGRVCTAWRRGPRVSGHDLTLNCRTRRNMSADVMHINLMSPVACRAAAFNASAVHRNRPLHAISTLSCSTRPNGFRFDTVCRVPLLEDHRSSEGRRFSHRENHEGSAVVQLPGRGALRLGQAGHSDPRLLRRWGLVTREPPRDQSECAQSG